MNPLVSIITPCYNGEEFLNKYFTSILKQTYDNLELIFVNDGSSDRTEEIALSYQAALEARDIVFKYLYQPNGGQAKAINTGFREMTGKYLIWPDSDDLLSPDSVEKRVAFLEEHPKIAWVRSNVDAFNYDTGEYLFHFAKEADKSTKDIFMDLILEKTYCCCCYMVRVCALKEIYPELQIYESRQGQNWQILIPMAGRHICGYVDGDLYRKRRSSVMYSPESGRQIVKDRIDYLSKRRVNVIARFPELRQSFDRHFMEMMVILSSDPLATKESNTIIKQQLRAYFKEKNWKMEWVSFKTEV